jgi:cobalamin biosynthesis protein CobT
MKPTTINRDIQILREVVVKITQLLAGQGLKVTQQGVRAYVETDPKTLKPVRVNIPYIPDNASEELVMAIQGFVDHEVAHILFTEWSVIASISDNKKLYILHNIVEDTWIEREIGKKWPGTVHNLQRLHQFFIDRVTGPAINNPEIKGNPERELSVLLVPAVRAWAGQEQFREFMGNNGHWNHPLLKKIIDEVPKSAIDGVSSISSSVEALQFAKLIYDVLTPETPPAEEKKEEKKPTKSCSKSGSKGKSDQKKAGEKSEASDDDGKSSDTSPEDEDETESKDSDGDDASEASKSEDEKKENESESKDSDGDEDEGESEDNTSSSGGEEGDGESNSDDASDSGDNDDEESPKSESKGKSGDPSKNTSEPSTAVEITLDENTTFERALQDKIGEESIAAMRDSEYKVYTKDFDRIEVLNVNNDSYKDEWLTQLDDKTSHMVGPMQKSIERMMAAKAQVLKVPGYRSGKLHGAGLHKLQSGDDRIFRRKFETKANDTAVILLIDNSGSMNGAASYTARVSKMEIAMASAYALSQTLDRVKIAHEVIGFTTRSFTSSMASDDFYEEQRKVGNFSRTEPIYMPIYKEFSERVNPSVRKRFAAAEHFVRMQNNVDGESIEVATQRLLRRPEKRRVLIVLSDGQPAWHCHDYDLPMRHTKQAVEKAEASGVETIGIGILDNTVRHFYPKHIILSDLQSLPAAVMTELKKVLAR